MTSSDTIRQKLHAYIDRATSEKIEALFILLKDDITYSYSPEMIADLYARRNKHGNKETKSFNVEESLNQIRNLYKS